MMKKKFPRLYMSPKEGKPMQALMISAEQKQLAERRFERLCRTWKEDTRHCSSTVKMILHPSYQQIIGMGELAIPLILRELKNENDFWYWALFSISGEDPAASDQKNDPQKIDAAWIRWGEENGYVPSRSH
ncbi:MAG: hypothetical protein NTX50_29655 [Candidatus Sumerlaeota bacterium]|nr:hypothetical protein [Candidatus Sumerlaeota bacterium]